MVFFLLNNNCTVRDIALGEASKVVIVVLSMVVNAAIPIIPQHRSAHYLKTEEYNTTKQIGIMPQHGYTSIKY